MTDVMERDAPLQQLKTRKQETRTRIVDAAGRLFREKGVDGVGVDQIMREAGLTHGGFYGHFASKEELVAEACAAATGNAAEYWRGVIDHAGPGCGVAAFVDAYLSGGCEMEGGCPIALLGPDVARRGEVVRKAYSERVSEFLDFLTDSFDFSRPHAIAIMSALVGGVSMIRASGDPRLTAETETAVRNAVLELARSGSTRVI
jgi:TetR/AcrR family transcriptional repressor of nem operon